MGVGMGGTSHDDSHFLMLDLCRACHDRAHMKMTLFTDEQGIIVWQDTDGRKGKRPAMLGIDQTDEALATKWANAQMVGAQAILQQAEVASSFRERYGGFDHWWVRVAEIIRDVTGLNVSVGLVYDRAALGIAMQAWPGDPQEFLEEYGIKASAAIGKAIEAGSPRDAVFEKAQEERETKSRTHVAQAIKRTFLGAGQDIGQDKKHKHVCRYCDEVWDSQLQ